MAKCAYCKKTKTATTKCARGLPACSAHKHAADEYFEKRTGRKPNGDTYLSCDTHVDFWQSGCPRCEACCQHHYRCTIKQRFGDAQTPEQHGVRIIEIEKTLMGKHKVVLLVNEDDDMRK